MKKSKFLQNDATLKILSIALAVFAWFSVVMFISTERTVTIRNVPVKIDVENSALNTLGLDLVSDGIVVTDVKITGHSSEIGSVSEKDITIEAILTGISEPGVYNVSVKATNINSTRDFKIVSVSPETFSLKFDRTATKQIAIELDLGDIQVADGYIMENIVVSPTTVLLTGPEEDINNVQSCVVKKEISNKLNKSEVFSSKLTLLDKDGKEIENSHISLSVNEVDITIPVLKSKELPITCSFLNMRPDFDYSSLVYRFSRPTIKVAGPEALIDKMSELSVGYVNSETLGDENKFEFDITLPSTFINIEDVNSVSLEFDFNGYEEGKFEVKTIELKNQPADYNVKVSTQKISSVNVFGPSEVIKNIKSGDLVAELDLSGVDLTVGQYKVPVSVYAPNHLNIWAKGTYYVVITVQAK